MQLEIAIKIRTKRCDEITSCSDEWKGEELLVFIHYWRLLQGTEGFVFIVTRRGSYRCETIIMPRWIMGGDIQCQEVAMGWVAHNLIFSEWTKVVLVEDGGTPKPCGANGLHVTGIGGLGNTIILQNLICMYFS